MKKLINDYFKMHKAINKESQFNKKVSLNIELHNFKKQHGLFLHEIGGLILIRHDESGRFLGKIAPIYKEDKSGNVYRSGYKYYNESLQIK